MVYHDMTIIMHMEIRREKETPMGCVGGSGSSFLVKVEIEKKAYVPPLTRCSQHLSLPQISTFLVTINSFDKTTKTKAPLPPNRTCASSISIEFSFYLLLVLGNTALGELKDDIAACQPPIHLTVCIKAVVDTTTLFLVQDDLESLAAILLGTGALADNLNWIDDVGEDGVMDSG